MDERAKRAAENIVAGIHGGGNDLGLVFKPEGEQTFVAAIVGAIENEYQPPPNPSIVQLIEEARENLQGVADGPWRWSHTYELPDAVHWCLHNPHSDEEKKTIDAALVLEISEPEYFHRPVPTLPNLRFVAWSRSAIDRFITALEQQVTARREAEINWKTEQAQGLHWFNRAGELEQMNAVLKYDWLALCGLRERFIEAQRLLIETSDYEVNNAPCWCHIRIDASGNFREALDHDAQCRQARIVTRIDPPPENEKYVGSWAWALEQREAGRIVGRQDKSTGVRLERGMKMQLWLVDVRATDWQLVEPDESKVSE